MHNRADASVACFFLKKITKTNSYLSNYVSLSGLLKYSSTKCVSLSGSLIWTSTRYCGNWHGRAANAHASLRICAQTSMSIRCSHTQRENLLRFRYLALHDMSA